MTSDPIQRLAEAAGRAITDTPDGRPWYRARDVCRALHMQDSAVRQVRPEYKYRRFEYRPGWRSVFTLYLSRAGVETLILLHGGLPRAEALAALDAATPQSR